MKDFAAIVLAALIALFGGYYIGGSEAKASCYRSFDRLHENGFLENEHYHADGSRHVIMWDLVQRVACDGEE